MPIRREEVKAICVDCQKEITGEIIINVADWSIITPVGLAEGPLTRACAEHHDEKRKWGKEDSPQHSDFLVFEGPKRIGEMRVASMVQEMRFTIVDEETYREYAEEARRIRREREY